MEFEPLFLFPALSCVTGVPCCDRFRKQLYQVIFIFIILRLLFHSLSMVPKLSAVNRKEFGKEKGEKRKEACLNDCTDFSRLI